MVATRLGSKVRVEGQETVNTVHGGSEVIRNEFGGLERDPAEVFVDLLERAQNEFLRFLMILIGEVAQHLPNDIKIDFARRGCVGIRVWHVRLLPAIQNAWKTCALMRRQFTAKCSRSPEIVEGTRG